MRQDREPMCPGRFLACALFLAGAAQCALAQSATLLVSTDLECRWSIDGDPKGVLKVDDRVRVSLPVGEHLIEAIGIVGGARWEKVVKLTEPTGQVLAIPLRAEKTDAERAQADLELANRGYWIDPDSRLMWAAKDNGYDVNWIQAGTYCKNLTAGGYRDWTLPTIEELEGLRSGEVPKGGVKVRGWAWSSSQGASSGEAWHYVFGYGARYSADVRHSNVERALCVRHAGE
jgi:Protein of unknown function (DUF1566)